jgi:hypothetical protein
MTAAAKIAERNTTAHGPLYELRLTVPARQFWFLEVFQLPSPATPRLTEPEKVASLRGHALHAVEHRVLKRLSRARIDMGSLAPGKRRTWNIEEEDALQLALLFRAVTPMRNLDRIRRVADMVEGMTREEAAYWLGMAVHRKNPRKVLAALRLLADAN